MAERNYSNTAQPVTLTDDIDDTTEAIPVTSTAGYPSIPFTIAIDRKTSDEELCFVTAKSSSEFTATRGYGNTTVQAHSSGHLVEHVVTAEDYDEANDHVNETSGKPHGDAYLSDGMVIIRHSGTASTSRPPVTSPVLWDGFVDPNNGIENDLLVRTDQNRIYRNDGDDWVELSAGVTDHGSLGGLSDNDHPQYPRREGGDVYAGDHRYQFAGRLKQPQLHGYSETFDVLPQSGTIDLDVNHFTVFRMHMTDDVTLNFTFAVDVDTPIADDPHNVGDQGGVISFTLIVDPNANAITWPGNVSWTEGEVPEVGDGIYVFTFLFDYVDDVWLGFLAGQEMS